MNAMTSQPISCRPSEPPLKGPSRGERLWAECFIVALLFFALWGPRQSFAAPVNSAESRLEAIRNQLIEEATKARTRVRSLAWIDEQGRLHEAARFTSDVKVRGVRVNDYLSPDTSGTPGKDQAKKPGAVQAVPTPADEACSEDRRSHQRHALFRLLPSVSGGFFNEGSMSQLSQSFGQELIGLLAAETGWSLTKAEGIALEPPADSYQRHLMHRIRDEAPHLLTVQFRDLGAIAKPGVNRQGILDQALVGLGLVEVPVRGRVEMQVELSERSSGQPLFTRRLQFDMEFSAKGYLDEPRAVLAEPSLAKASLAKLQKEFREFMGCDRPEYPVIERRSKDELLVNGGGRLGLKIGEQVLVSKAGQLPKRILETGVASNLALAEVVSVVEDRAVVKVIAGPKPSSIEQLVISPL